MVSALVRSNVRLSEIALLRSLDPDLDASARKALKRWRFHPAHDPSGRLVPVRMTIDAHFRLP